MHSSVEWRMWRNRFGSKLMGEMSMPHAPEPFARSLKDYAEDYQWIRLLDWSDEDLARVQVHEEPDSSQELIDLANLGGTRLSVSDADLATSADVNLGVVVHPQSRPVGPGRGSGDGCIPLGRRSVSCCGRTATQSAYLRPFRHGVADRCHDGRIGKDVSELPGHVSGL